MKKIINQLAQGNSLNIEDAQNMFTEFLDGRVGQVEMASVLTALKIKGESSSEIAGAALAIRNKTSQTQFDFNVVDTCGTGGDGSGSFNISTAAAFVVAGAGLAVAKHGNRSITSKSGSADVLEALDVNVNVSESQAIKTLESTGIGFFYAPSIHKSMKAIMPVRRALGFRTIFNLVGPLCNPVKLSGQVIGVGDLNMIDTLTQAAQLMGLENIMFVCSEKGLDELTLSGSNHTRTLRNNQIEKAMLSATDLGFNQAPDSALKGGSPSHNAGILESVLKNEPSEYLNVVVLNAAAVIFMAGKADSMEEAVILAKRSISEGSALKKLSALKSSRNFDFKQGEHPNINRAINRMVGM